MDMTIDGLDATITGLDGVGLEVREAAYYAIVEALQKAFKACYTLLSESDHTLRDLALMGHPYGNKHAQIIHEPDVIVHVQRQVDELGMEVEGYRDALRAIAPTASGGDIIGGSIVNDSPLDRWIQEGTVNMRARPWMQWIVDNYGGDLADLVVARIIESAKALAA